MIYKTRYEDRDTCIRMQLLNMKSNEIYQVKDKDKLCILPAFFEGIGAIEDPEDLNH